MRSGGTDRLDKKGANPMLHQTIDTADANSTLTHSARLSLFSKERTYRLEPDALVWSEGNKSGRLPYDAVKYVHIYSVPPAMGQKVRRTILKSDLSPKVVIAGAHFAGLGQFEDRSDSYFAFVEELLARVTAARPDVPIRVGQSWLLYGFWVAMLVLSAILLPLMAIIIFDGGFEPRAIPAIGIMLVFLPVSWKIVRRGRPRFADASALRELDLG
jgi:hypothetical protein